MSIVALKKVTLVGMREDKERLIEELQALGCAHVIPLSGAGPEGLDAGRGARPATSADALQALQFLEAVRGRRQVAKAKRHLARFDARTIELQALDLRTRLHELRARREHLVQRLKTLEPWGHFDYPDIGLMGGQRLWFYQVPPRDLPRVAEAADCWEVVHRTGRVCHVVVVSPEEPDRMPVPREHVGDKSIASLEEELEEVELAIEDAEADRDRLSRWALLLSRNIDELHDLAAREQAAALTLDSGPLAALQAWVPAARVDEVERVARPHGFACLAEDPGPDEEAPTLLQNSAAMAAGEDLVTFYATPGYRSWDPSGVVFVAFALFFAMILADAGYAAVLGVMLLVFWQRLGRGAGGLKYRRLGATLVLASLGYGILVGSYFGAGPPEGSWLQRLRLIDMADSNAMMRLCVLIGAAHVILGNVMEARRHRWSRGSLPPLGWAGFVAGGLAMAAGTLMEQAVLLYAGGVTAAAGLALVLGFSAAPGSGWKGRLASALGSLMGITGAFGDVLSYLRLFALGLASSSLATTFNEMAGQIRAALPGIGLLLAILVLIPGHLLNLVLGAAGGVIHGLRLNVIEFFNWSLKEEGRLFNPLQQRTQPWNKT